MPQETGSNSIVAWKSQKTFDKADFPAVTGGGSTTLGGAATPGATSIVVGSGAGFAAGDLLLVGGDDNAELVEIDASYTSGTAIPLNPSTFLNFRHESGEPVVEVAAGGFKQLGAFTSLSPSGGVGRLESAAIAADGMLENIRSGNIDAGGTLNFEVAQQDTGVLLVNALGEGYTSTGSPKAGGASTTLGAAAAKGDASITVASITNIAAGDLLQVGASGSEEIVEVDGSWDGVSTTIPITTEIRLAHGSGDGVTEVEAPFTHTIKRGALPPGLTLLVKLTGIGRYYLLTGVKINTLSLTFTHDRLPAASIGFVAKRFQVLRKDIFGALAATAHTPYAHHETTVNEGGSVLPTWTEFTLNISNNLPQGNRAGGSQFIKSAPEGDRRADVSLTYQLFDSSLQEKAVLETESSFEFISTSKLDANHRLQISLPRTRLTGTSLPAIPGKGPIEDVKTIDALKDAAEATDVKVVLTTAGGEWILG